MKNEFCGDKNLFNSVIRRDIENRGLKEEIGLDSCVIANKRNTIDDELLTRQLERLWNTDFKESTVDKKALEVMARSLKRKDDHFQVALPWRKEPVDIPNDKPMAERRLESLKRRLKKDSKLFEKYKRAMQDKTRDMLKRFQKKS